MEPTEIYQNVNKIKELLKSKDFDVVNSGLDLAQALNEEAIYEKLLEGCGVDKEGKLVNEKKEISNYLVCTLSSLSNSPKSKEIIEKVTTLVMNDSNMTNEDGENILDYFDLPKLNNLNELDLSKSYSMDEFSLQNVPNLKKLTIDHTPAMYITPEELPKLSELSICGWVPDCDLLGDNLYDLDFLSNFENLESLTLISCEVLEDINGLANLKKLSKLVLEGTKALEDLNVLTKLNSLEHLELNYCYDIELIPDRASNYDGIVDTSFETTLKDKELKSYIEKIKGNL